MYSNFVTKFNLQPDLKLTTVYQLSIISIYFIQLLKYSQQTSFSYLLYIEHIYAQIYQLWKYNKILIVKVSVSDKSKETLSSAAIPTVLPAYSLMNSQPGTCSSVSVARMFSSSRNMIFCFSAMVRKLSGLSEMQVKRKMVINDSLNHCQIPHPPTNPLGNGWGVSIP